MKNIWQTASNFAISGTVFLSLSSLLTSTARAVELYTMTNPCDLVLIDTDLETQTTIGTLGHSVEAMAFSPTGELFGSIQPNVCAVHTSATHLARIDPLTAEVTVIGAFGFRDVDAMAFRPDGTLFGVSAATDELFEINTSTGAGNAVSSVGSVGFPFLGGIEFLSDAQLVGADMVGGGGGPGTFISINQATGIGESIGPINFNSIEGMTFGLDGVLYGLSDTIGNGTGAIVSIDPATGIGEFVQSVSSSGYRDGLAARKLFSPGVGDSVSTPEPGLAMVFGAITGLFPLRQRSQRRLWK